MNQADLDQILAQHAEWLADPTKGKRADLRSADLSGANLRHADLRYANLHIANLIGADLRYANLCGASVDPVAWVEAHERAIFLNFTQDRWVALWKDSTYALPAEWQTFWELFK